MIKDFFKKLIVITILFSGCTETYEGYESVDNDIHFKLLSFDDEGEPFDGDEFAKLSLKVWCDNEIKYQLFNIHLTPLDGFFLASVIEKLHENDSVELLLGNEFISSNLKLKDFECDSNGLVKAGLKVDKLLSSDEAQEFNKSMDREAKEFELINQYVKSLNNVKTLNGIYYQILAEGRGENVKKGDELKFNYEGKFLTGIGFDDSFTKKEFEYSYGTPEQVIAGFDLVFSEMKEGGKVKIIIPSHLAFGSEGSSTGIVPAFTPVMYNITLNKIN